MSAPQSPREALLAAVIAHLAADAAVAGLVGSDTDGVRVYDEVPTGKPAPYVFVGPMNFTAVQVGCGGMANVRFRLFAAATDFGRVGAATIGFAVLAAIAGAQLVLAAPYQANGPVEFIQDGDVIDPADPKSVFIDCQVNIAWPG